MDIERQITIQAARKAMPLLELGLEYDVNEAFPEFRDFFAKVRKEIPEGEWSMAENRVFLLQYLDEIEETDAEEEWNEEQNLAPRTLYLVFELKVTDSGARLVELGEVDDRPAYTNPRDK